MKLEWAKKADGRWSTDLNLKINGKITVASIYRTISARGMEPKINLMIKLPGIKLKPGTIVTRRGIGIANRAPCAS